MLVPAVGPLRKPGAVVSSASGSASDLAPQRFQTLALPNHKIPYCLPAPRMNAYHMGTLGSACAVSAPRRRWLRICAK